MKKLFQISLVLLSVLSATAEDDVINRLKQERANELTATRDSAPSEKVFHIYDWKDLNVLQKLPGSEIISIDGIQTWKIQITNSAPLEVSLLTVTNLSILKKTFATQFSFEMKYENAKFDGWNRPDFLALSGIFPPLAIGGDQRTNTSDYTIDGYSSISRSENWHPQELKGIWLSGSLPTKLELKLYLSGSGTFYFRPIKLLGTTKSSNWWSPQQSGLIGGIGGSIIGCFGGLIGLLVSKGKARKFVLTATASAIVLGILLTIGGLVAAILKQPYSVWYALLFPGVILVLVFSLNLHSIQRRYDELEIRRMTSIDTMES